MSLRDGWMIVDITALLYILICISVKWAMVGFGTVVGSPAGSSWLSADTFWRAYRPCQLLLKWNYSVVIGLILFFIRVYKYFRFHSSLRIYLRFLKLVGDLFQGFLVVFGVTVVAFAGIFYALFANSGTTADFLTFRGALHQIVKITFSFVDYDAFTEKNAQIGSFSTIVIFLFWFAIISLLILAQNVILAIVTSAHDQARRDTSDGNVFNFVIRLGVFNFNFGVVFAVTYMYRSLCCCLIPLDDYSFSWSSAHQHPPPSPEALDSKETHQRRPSRYNYALEMAGRWASWNEQLPLEAKWALFIRHRKLLNRLTVLFVNAIDDTMSISHFGSLFAIPEGLHLTLDVDFCSTNPHCSQRQVEELKRACNIRPEDILKQQRRFARSSGSTANPNPDGDEEEDSEELRDEEIDVNDEERHRGLKSVLVSLVGSSRDDPRCVTLRLANLSPPLKTDFDFYIERPDAYTSGKPAPYDAHNSSFRIITSSGKGIEHQRASVKARNSTLGADRLERLSPMAPVPIPELALDIFNCIISTQMFCTICHTVCDDARLREPQHPITGQKLYPIIRNVAARATDICEFYSHYGNSAILTTEIYASQCASYSKNMYDSVDDTVHQKRYFNRGTDFGGGFRNAIVCSKVEALSRQVEELTAIVRRSQEASETRRSSMLNSLGSLGSSVNDNLSAAGSTLGQAASTLGSLGAWTGLGPSASVPAPQSSTSSSSSGPYAHPVASVGGGGRPRHAQAQGGARRRGSSLGRSVVHSDGDGDGDGDAGTKASLKPHKAGKEEGRGALDPPSPPPSAQTSVAGIGNILTFGLTDLIANSVTTTKRLPSEGDSGGDDPRGEGNV